MSEIKRNLLPVIPGRAAATDRAEMVTQLLYGEHFEILQEEEKWVQVRCLNDDYHCWLDRRQVEAAGAREEAGEVLVSNVSAPSNVKLPVLFSGSRLTASEAESIQGGAFSDITSFAKEWLGSPYLWGGKTYAGVDCSGFVQVAFAVQGIQLPRDAWQQAERGNQVSFAEESQSGDLAFFDNPEGRITHVGIILKNESGIQIIHASGQVRLDAFDHQGIFDRGAGRYTHQLRIIKRIEA